MAWWIWAIIGLLFLIGLRKLVLYINLLPQVPIYQSKRHFTIMKQLYRSGHARYYLTDVPEKYILEYEALVLKNPTYSQYRRELRAIIKQMRSAGIDIRTMTVITVIWKDTYFDC